MFFLERMAGDPALEQLVSMGFERGASKIALEAGVF